MTRLVASAVLVAAIAVAGMTGAFAQSGNPDSGTGIGKLQPPPPPPPPPEPLRKSGTGIGKLKPVEGVGPGFQHGTVVWVSHAGHRFTLRHRGTRHVFAVRRSTVFRVRHHRVSFSALRVGARAQVTFHRWHHRRIADRVTISRR